MTGYQEILKTIMSGHRLNKAFVYVDAVPYRINNCQTIKKFPVGVILADLSDDPSVLSFHALSGVPVHVFAGSMDRARAFADRIWSFNAKLIVIDDGLSMEIMREAK